MPGFDEMAGISEMEKRHHRAFNARNKAARDAAAADYARTGKMPEGYQMVFGTVAAVQPKIPASPAEVAQAAQAMTGQPAAPAQVVRQKVTQMPRPGLGRRKGFFKNLAAGHIKADDLAPEFWTNLHADDKKAVEDALAKAGGVKPVVSDVDFNTMLAMMEATSFDEMIGFSKPEEDNMSLFDRVAGLAEGSMSFKHLTSKQNRRAKLEKKTGKKDHTGFVADARRREHHRDTGDDRAFAKSSGDPRR